MRLNLSLTANDKTIPFDYQHKLTGRLHKWLGENDIHDDLSLYSFSWLWNSEKRDDGFSFPNGARWAISCWNPAMAKFLMDGIMKDTEILNGMKVNEVTLQQIPEFGNDYTFTTSSPILIRMKREDGSVEHLDYRDERFDERIKQVLNRKAQKAKLELSEFDIMTDKKYKGNKTKMVKIKDIGNKANFVRVRIKGDENAIKFAWA